MKLLHPDRGFLASAVVAVVVVVVVVLVDSRAQLDQFPETNLAHLLITADQATRLIFDTTELLAEAVLDAPLAKLLTLQANLLMKVISLLLLQIDSVNPVEKEILDAPEIPHFAKASRGTQMKAEDLLLPRTDQAVAVIDARELSLAEAVNSLMPEAKLLAVNPMISVSAKTEELATNVLATTDLVATNVLALADHLAEAGVLPTPAVNQVVINLVASPELRQGIADQVVTDLVATNRPAEVAPIAPDKI